MNRFNRYQEFRKVVDKTYSKLVEAELSPFGRRSVTELHYAELMFDTFSPKWQERITFKIWRRVEQYTKPIVQGNDGEWYSAYDMDHMMMGGNY